MIKHCGYEFRSKRRAPPQFPASARRAASFTAASRSRLVEQAQLKIGRHSSCFFTAASCLQEAAAAQAPCAPHAARMRSSAASGRSSRQVCEHEQQICRLGNVDYRRVGG